MAADFINDDICPEHCAGEILIKRERELRNLFFGIGFFKVFVCCLLELRLRGSRSFSLGVFREEIGPDDFRTLKYREVERGEGGSQRDLFSLNSSIVEHGLFKALEMQRRDPRIFGREEVFLGWIRVVTWFNHYDEVWESQRITFLVRERESE